MQKRAPGCLEKLWGMKYDPIISRLDTSQLVGETTQLTKDRYDHFQQDILVLSNFQTAFDIFYGL